MIGKAIKGRGARGLLEYLLNGARATTIGGTLAGSNPREMAAEIGAIRRLRPRMGKAILHLPISAHPKDRPLSDQDWNDIANYIAHGLGYEGCPMKFIRHNDTEHDHIHLVICRIDGQGKAVSDSNDYRRIETLLRDIERKYDLHRVEQPRAGGKEKHYYKENDMNTENNLPAHDTTAEGTSAQHTETGESESAANASLPTWAMTMTEPQPANISKRATDKRRRELKREVLTSQYEQTMRQTFGSALNNIYQHTGGAVLYFADKPKAIRDSGNEVTAHHMSNQEAAQLLVRMAQAKQWKSATFTGPPDFVRAAMQQALKAGLPVVPADEVQAALLEEVSNQNGIESVTQAGKPVQPLQLAAFREQRKRNGTLNPEYTPPKHTPPQWRVG